ncbi:MAG TPA: precorrin-3B C(17)-methyltransferase [Alphaproteobacteria bacterium]|nr:precorrin-3B C(17)-methyltransferase [Alphaproteobacteria bacterium]
MAMKHPALVALTAAGAAMGRRIQRELPQAELHGLASRVSDADRTFTDTVPHLRSLFEAGVPIIGICATGIVIRALAPLLSDKTSEPPVLSLADDGSAVVPLLGGHRGANALARRLAALTGGTAAITTAGDLGLGIALDAPPRGWRIHDRAMVKPLAAAMLAREPVALRVQAGDASWIAASGYPFTDDAPIGICVSHRASAATPQTLVYRPQVLALGVGCERGADPRELEDLVRTTLVRHDLAPEAVACVSSLDLKADEAAVLALADSFGVPARFFTAEALAREEPRLATPSDAVRSAVGVPGVAEAAALASAGPAGALLVPKQRSPRATCAIALSPRDIDASTIGRARGQLSVVGIGPGHASWRTPEVDAALAQATDVVGYGLYLDLLGSAIGGKRRHESALGAEEVRARLALDLAAEGRSVALVSSGDAGIYGLAALVFELLERGDVPGWRRIALRVCPGLSALQAAAARAGAPLGHDFCAVSLSDLLTPWSEIERRLQAAADGDFAVALYNPASARRRDQLRRAIHILRAQRPPATPVIAARNLGRVGESVETTTLAAFDMEAVDMLTLLLIGSSRTRAFATGSAHWVYTPRGYAVKRAAHPDAVGASAEKP